MRTNLGVALATIERAVRMVIKSIAEKDYYEYDEPKGLQWTGFSGFYIFISKLPITDKEETIEHYFSLSVVTPKSRYPTDVLDISKTKTGIDIHFCGLKAPLVYNHEQPYLTAPEIDAAIRLIVNGNPDLIKIIEEHKPGGQNEHNRNGK